MFRKGFFFTLTLMALLVLVAATAAAETIGYVTSTGLNIRKTPSDEGQVLRCAENGEALVILRTEGDWYYVKYNSVVSGYVAKKFVSTKKPAGASNTSNTSGGTTAVSTDDSLPDKISDLGKAPATSRLKDRGADVKKLQQALKILGYYTGTCDGIFGEVTETAVKKFQKARSLSQDGIAGKVTIKLLFGENAADDTGSGSSSGSGSGSSSASGAKTEKLDWYKDNVSSVIPKGTYVTVKDVRTGTTFRAKHLYGSNHMDAEPLTAADTATMKAIYGGSWSWDTRAILILCSGRVFAASMNGMPHGEQSIYDNNFDGQFCIHFLNSKTHGSDSINPEHQYCVKVAAESSW